MSFDESPLKQNTKLAEQTLRQLQGHMACFGYRTLNTPIIERADLFLTRAGDQVINKLFTFNRWGQELALRPEFTAIAAHYFVNQVQDSVVRWQFSGPIFVDDPNSIRHDFQQMSLGAELIGLSGAVIDAELIGLAAQGLDKINIPNYRVVVGHAGLTRQLLNSFDLDNRTAKFLLKNIDALHEPSLGKQYVLEQFEYALKGEALTANLLLDTSSTHDATMEQTEANTQHMLQLLLDATRRSTTMGGRTQYDIARRLLQKQQRFTETQQVLKALDFLENWIDIRATPAEAFNEMKQYVEDDPIATHQLLEWQKTIHLLDLYGVKKSNIVIQPYLARNWEYYTGSVFELVSKDDLQLTSGGRYDELVALIGADETVPAIGFAYYLDNVFDCIEPPYSNDACMYCVVLTDENTEVATQLANTLRAHEIAVILLPEHSITSGYVTIAITASGEIVFDNTPYSLTNIEILITAIRQNDHGN